jgi:hypothetical protein
MPRRPARLRMGTMRIGLTGIVVDDQDQAEQFSTQVLGADEPARAFQATATLPQPPQRPRSKETCSAKRASTGRSCSTVRWCARDAKGQRRPSSRN